MRSDSDIPLHDIDIVVGPFDLVSVWDKREKVLAIPFALLALVAAYLINTSLSLQGAMALLALLGPMLFAVIVLIVVLANYVYWKRAELQDGVLELERSDGRDRSIPLDRVLAVELFPDSLFGRLPGKGLPMDVHTTDGATRVWATHEQRARLHAALVQQCPEAIDICGHTEIRLLAPTERNQRLWMDECAELIRQIMKNNSGRSASIAILSGLVAALILLIAIFEVLQGAQPTAVFNRFLLTLLFALGMLSAIKGIQFYRNARRLRTFHLQLQSAAEGPLDDIMTSDGRILLYRDEARPERVSPRGKAVCLMGLLFCWMPLVGFGLSLSGLYLTWVKDHGPWRLIAWLGVLFGFFSTSFLITTLVL